MKIIGLSGGSGSGKGMVSEIFSELSVYSIDTDALYHEMTSKKSELCDELRCEFGDTIITRTGALNRAALAKIVFSGEGSTERLERLNAITHRRILARVREIIADCSSRNISLVIVDAPLLFESGFDKECDAVISVIADRELRIERIMSRDNISRDAAERRIASQLPDEYLSAHSDYVIVNNGDVAALRKSVFDVAEKILIK